MVKGLTVWGEWNQIEPSDLAELIRQIAMYIKIEVARIWRAEHGKGGNYIETGLQRSGERTTINSYLKVLELIQGWE